MNHSSDREILENQPLVTVITVVFNCEAYLEEAILSVLSQTYPHIEYLIIDGGSTDKTCEIIRRYESAIDYWVSEPDHGIYDAMNKGIGLSNGKYIGFLNADDVLIPDSVERIVSAFSGLNCPAYSTGPVELVSHDGQRYGVSRPLSQAARFRRRFLEIPCPHMAFYADRLLYDEFGLYDTQFKLRADYDFMLRLIKHDIPVVEIDAPIGKFRSGGASGGIKTYLETLLVHRKHGVNVLVSIYFCFRSIIKISLASCAPTHLKKIIGLYVISKNSYD